MVDFRFSVDTNASGQKVNKDGLEGWPMSIKEQLVTCSVVEAQPLLVVPEQRRRMTIKLRVEHLEVETTHVDSQSATKRRR